MKTISSISVGTILLIIAGCSGGRYVEMTRAGESAYREGDYRKALEYSEKIIGEVEGKGKQSAGNVYALAGISACELGDYDKSLNYLLKAQQQDYSDGNMYLCLAWNYRHINNLSKEITALESYVALYPHGNEIGTVRESLFRTCLESENFELAGELWTKMDSASRKDVTNLETYLNLNRMQENDSTCNSVAALILDKDSDNEPALSWFAKYYYRKAENSYQAQMKAYKENRTHKQYAIYLGNIFTRLEDEKKADYYKKRAD